MSCNKSINVDEGNAGLFKSESLIFSIDAFNPCNLSCDIALSTMMSNSKAKQLLKYLLEEAHPKLDEELLCRILASKGMFYECCQLLLFMKFKLYPSAKVISCQYQCFIAGIQYLPKTSVLKVIGIGDEDTAMNEIDMQFYTIYQEMLESMKNDRESLSKLYVIILSRLIKDSDHKAVFKYFTQNKFYEDLYLAQAALLKYVYTSTPFMDIYHSCTPSLAQAPEIRFLFVRNLIFQEKFQCFIDTFQSSLSILQNYVHHEHWFLEVLNILLCQKYYDIAIDLFTGYAGLIFHFFNKDLKENAFYLMIEQLPSIYYGDLKSSIAISENSSIPKDIDLLKPLLLLKVLLNDSDAASLFDDLLSNKMIQNDDKDMEWVLFLLLYSGPSNTFVLQILDNYADFLTQEHTKSLNLPNTSPLKLTFPGRKAKVHLYYMPALLTPYFYKSNPAVVKLLLLFRVLKRKPTLNMYRYLIYFIYTRKNDSPLILRFMSFIKESMKEKDDSSLPVHIINSLLNLALKYDDLDKVPFLLTLLLRCKDESIETQNNDIIYQLNSLIQYLNDSKKFIHHLHSSFLLTKKNSVMFSHNYVCFPNYYTIEEFIEICNEVWYSLGRFWTIVESVCIEHNIIFVAGIRKYWKENMYEFKDKILTALKSSASSGVDSNTKSPIDSTNKEMAELLDFFLLLWTHIMETPKIFAHRNSSTT